MIWADHLNRFDLKRMRPAYLSCVKKCLISSFVSRFMNTVRVFWKSTTLNSNQAAWSILGNQHGYAYMLRLYWFNWNVLFLSRKKENNLGPWQNHGISWRLSYSFNSLVRGNFGYANFLMEISDLFSPAGSHKQLQTCFVNIASISKHVWQL